MGAIVALPIYKLIQIYRATGLVMKIYLLKNLKIHYHSCLFPIFVKPRQ
jgi:hypothetical protein